MTLQFQFKELEETNCCDESVTVVTNLTSSCLSIIQFFVATGIVRIPAEEKESAVFKDFLDFGIDLFRISLEPDAEAEASIPRPLREQPRSNGPLLTKSHVASNQFLRAERTQRESNSCSEKQVPVDEQMFLDFVSKDDDDEPDGDREEVSDVNQVSRHVEDEEGSSKPKRSRVK